MSIYIDTNYTAPDTDESQTMFNDLVNDFTMFRKGLLKKRHPKHIYTPFMLALKCENTGAYEGVVRLPRPGRGQIAEAHAAP